MALRGSLLRACVLIRRGWMDSAIYRRLAEDFPGATKEQYLAIIALAHEGTDYTQRFDFTDLKQPVDFAGAPQLPQE